MRLPHDIDADINLHRGTNALDVPAVTGVFHLTSPTRNLCEGEADTQLDSGGHDSGGHDSGGNRSNSRDGDSGEDEASRADILKEYGKTDGDIPEDLKRLSGASLNAYLKATQKGLSAWLATNWPGWRIRVAADAEFPFKVLMEETVGLGLAASGMIAARGKDILSELDFAFCDIAVGGTLNFILVYLLAPCFGAKSGRFASLPSNLFVQGHFSLPARIAGFVYKGVLFSACGFAGSLVGTTLSQSLLFVRQTMASRRSDAKPVVKKELPNVLVNSAAWAGFMFVSANPRYQALAGVERALFTYAPETGAKLGSALLRTGNNVIGGAIWVWWARLIGLQSRPDVKDKDSADGDKTQDD